MGICWHGELLRSKAAAGRPKVGARFIVHCSFGGRGEATPLPWFALRRTGGDVLKVGLAILGRPRPSRDARPYPMQRQLGQHAVLPLPRFN